MFIKLIDGTVVRKESIDVVRSHVIIRPMTGQPTPSVLIVCGKTDLRIVFSTTEKADEYAADLARVLEARTPAEIESYPKPV
jgi:hypothetical protein